MSIDKTNHLICMNDCCLYSLGNWLEFNILSEDKKVLMDKGTSKIKHLISGKTSEYPMQDSETCIINSYTTAFILIKEMYPIVYFSLFFIIPTSITILVSLVLIINIIYYGMKIKSTRFRKSTRNYGFVDKLDEWSDKLLRTPKKKKAKTLEDLEDLQISIVC